MRTKMTHLKKSFAKKSAPKKALAKKTPMKRPCCNKKSMKRSCWITAERVDKTSVTLSGEVELSVAVAEYNKLVKLARKGDGSLRIYLEKNHAEYFKKMAMVAIDDLKAHGFCRSKSLTSIMKELKPCFDLGVLFVASHMNLGMDILDNIWDSTLLEMEVKEYAALDPKVPKKQQVKRCRCKSSAGKEVKNSRV